MRRSLAALGFTAVAPAVYIGGFVNDWTPFKYYPLIGVVTTGTLGYDAGPAMKYYGWITMGFGAGLLAAAVAAALPRRFADRPMWGLAWAAPAAAILWGLWYEKHWFLA